MYTKRILYTCIALFCVALIIKAVAGNGNGSKKNGNGNGSSQVKNGNGNGNGKKSNGNGNGHGNGNGQNNGGSQKMADKGLFTELTNMEDLKLSSGQTTLLLFTSESCSACVRIKELLTQFLGSTKMDVSCYLVDTGNKAVEPLARMLKVEHVPTMQVIHTYIGAPIAGNETVFQKRLAYMFGMKVSEPAAAPMETPAPSKKDKPEIMVSDEGMQGEGGNEGMEIRPEDIEEVEEDMMISDSGGMPAVKALANQ